MANTPVNTICPAWQPTVELREELIHKYRRDPTNSRLVELRIAAVEEKLLDMSSPDFEAVLLKLHLLWKAQLEGDGAEARHKRLILDDLACLID